MAQKIKKRICILLFVIMMIALGVGYLISRMTDDLPTTTVEKMVDALRNDKTMVVLFGRDSCGVCISSIPAVEQAADELDLRVYYLDGDKTDGNVFLLQHGIKLSPALIIIKDGELKKYESYFDVELAKQIMCLAMDTTKDRFNTLELIDYDVLMEKMSSNTDFLLYIGRNDCKDCQDFMPVLQEYIDENQNAGVYYLDIKQERDKASDDSTADARYEQLKTVFQIEWVPTLYHIRNGKIISAYQYLNEEYYQIDDDREKNEVKEAFLNQFVSWMRKNV